LSAAGAAAEVCWYLFVCFGRFDIPRDVPAPPSTRLDSLPLADQSARRLSLAIITARNREQLAL
jgi:hypothetical protein